RKGKAESTASAANAKELFMKSAVERCAQYLPAALLSKAAIRASSERSPHRPLRGASSSISGGTTGACSPSISGSAPAESSLADSSAMHQVSLRRTSTPSRRPVLVTGREEAFNRQGVPSQKPARRSGPGK